jgi:23S rRNA pseudouridine1911/1915/1917 synthase
LTLNRGYVYRERLGPAARGRTLLAYLSERYPHSSPLEWRARIEGGLVLIDGVAAESGRKLSPGESLAWNRPPWREPEAPTGFAVLYQDRDVLAVAKPAGLPTLPGGGFVENTLLHRVRRSYPKASPLHRLGRGTSGIVLFALNPEARRALVERWEDEVERGYRGIVQGAFPAGETTIELPIGPVPHPLLRSVHGVSPAGKRARTRARLVEERGDRSLVEIEIGTGRTNQIRIHLAATGHPLVGDRLYVAGGVPAPGGTALPGEPGYQLHAHRVRFPHPREPGTVEVHCGPTPPYRGAAD